MHNSIAPEQIASAILILRGQRVLQDSQLAALYGVSTKRFNEQVRRNRKRFPADFMFQLTAEETSSLRSQIATLKTGRGQHRKYLPYVFTEHGAIMAATILNSPRAIEMSDYVVRAFVQLREMVAGWRLSPHPLGDTGIGIHSTSQTSERLTSGHCAATRLRVLARSSSGVRASFLSIIESLSRSCMQPGDRARCNCSASDSSRCRCLGPALHDPATIAFRRAISAGRSASARY